MPADFALKPENHIVCSRCWGLVTDDDLLGHMEELRVLFNDGTLDSRWRQVADFSGTESYAGISAEGIRRLAKQNPWPLGSWRALIAPSDVIFGFGRMYQLVGEEKGDFVGVVRSEEEALTWISQT